MLREDTREGIGRGRKISAGSDPPRRRNLASRQGNRILGKWGLVATPAPIYFVGPRRRRLQSDRSVSCRMSMTAMPRSRN